MLDGRTILVSGAGGMLGRAFVAELAEVAGIRLLARTRGQLDVTDRAAVMALVGEKPDLIVHCAADVNAERCEDNAQQCRAVQVGGTANIAALAEATGALVVYPQSFLIFDGAQLPISESTPPNPLSVYGRAKLEAEEILLARLPGSLVVRMAGFFGGDAGDKNFVGLFTRRLATLIEQGADYVEIGDRVWQPTYTRDLARNTLALVDHAKTGIYTMAAHGEAAFHELAAAVVAILGLERRIHVEPVSAALVASREKARRPDRAVMDNARLRAEGLDLQRPWRTALAEYLARPYFRSLFEA